MMDARARAQRYARAALDARCADLAMARGDRNRRLNEAAFYLAGFSAAGLLDRDEVERDLFAAAQANGYVARDGTSAARATIRSGLAAGLATPRWPPEHDRAGRRFRPDPAEVARIEEARRLADLDAQADAKKRRRAAARVWWRAGDPHRTVVERFLDKRLTGLPPEIAGTVLRFDPCCPCGNGETALAMVALMRCVLTGEPRAVHRTFLSPDGQKLGRKMLGDARGCAVMLDPFEDITAGLVAGEGIESCLAARLLGLRPVWAMCSTSMLAHLPVLRGVEALTLLAENDANGASDRACAKVGARWIEAGRAVDLARPPQGLKDANDILLEEGLAA